MFLKHLKLNDQEFVGNQLIGKLTQIQNTLLITQLFVCKFV